MNYVPAVAWGMCPGGTDKQVSNYAASWGLFGDAPVSSWVPDLATAGYSIPTHATWISMPNMSRGIMSLIILIWLSFR